MAADGQRASKKARFDEQATEIHDESVMERTEGGTHTADEEDAIPEEQEEEEDVDEEEDDEGEGEGEERSEAEEQHEESQAMEVEDEALDNGEDSD